MGIKDQALHAVRTRADGLFETPCLFAGREDFEKGVVKLTERALTTKRSAYPSQMQACLKSPQLPSSQACAESQWQQVTLKARNRVNGQGAGHWSHTITPTASVSKSTVDIHMMTIESWAHMGDRTRTFRAHAYTLGWLEWLARHAEDRQGGSIEVPIMKACEGSIGIWPECVHALAHR